LLKSPERATVKFAVSTVQKASSYVASVLRSKVTSTVDELRSRSVSVLM